MKIHPVGPELFHADGRTDMPKLIVAIRSFANAPKKKSLKSDTSITDCMLVPSNVAIGTEFRKYIIYAPARKLSTNLYDIYHC